MPERKQVLTALDEAVMVLLRADVPLMLGWDVEKNVFLFAQISDESCDDDPPFDQEDWLEYQVSDGFPGDRGQCNSYYSMDEAQTAFDKVCASGWEA